MDDVAADRVAEIQPGAVIAVAPQTPHLVGAGLERTGVEFPLRDRQGGDEHGIARAATIGPLRIHAGIDTEVEIAVVRLGGGGDAAVGDYGQLQSPTGVGVELADQGADNVAVVGRGPNPGGDRELTRAHVQGRVVLCL